MCNAMVSRDRVQFNEGEDRRVREEVQQYENQEGWKELFQWVNKTEQGRLYFEVPERQQTDKR